MIESVNPIDFRSNDFKQFKNEFDKVVSDQSLEEQAEIEQIGLKIQLQEYLTKNDGEIRTIGEFLMSFFKKIGIRQTKIASILDIRPSNLNKILKGERRLNMIMAVQIGEITDLDPNLLIQVQAKNELVEVRKKSRRKVKTYKDLVKE